MRIHAFLSALTIASALIYTPTSKADSGSGDTVINYKLGLALLDQGDMDGAYKHFKKACMARNGLVDACLAWAEMAEAMGNEKDVKRSLGSAVILDPDDIRARTMLAIKLIKKEDYAWAKEHLVQAIENAENSSDLALLRYYHAYVLFKTGVYEESKQEFEEAKKHLPPDYMRRSDYYLALIEKRLGNQTGAVALLKGIESGEEDDRWSEAAEDVLESWSAFLKSGGFSGRLSASFGVNTHPSSAFLDTVEADAKPVLQSVFRGDLIYGKRFETNGIQGILTAYREQNWHEIGEEGPGTAENASETENIADDYTPSDFNTTVFLGQASFLSQTWGDKFEHELKLGIDGDVQFLDHPPIKDGLGHYYREEDLFRLTGWALGGKIWWSFASSRDSLYSLRLKIEGRPNYIDRDRSAIRYRLRLNHTRYTLSRKLQLKLMAGTRYDRTYHDPTVIKYDRIMPEAEASLRWSTPWSRLTALLTGQFKYNWYLNSRQNQKNSFRPQYLGIDLSPPLADMDMDDMEDGDMAIQQSIDELQAHLDNLEELLNAYFEQEYYSLTRKDVEWELGGEIQLNLWSGAQLVLLYKRHQRISNIDDAPVGRYTETTTVTDPETGESVQTEAIQSLPAPRYSYTRDLVMLELRQRF